MKIYQLKISLLFTTIFAPFLIKPALGQEVILPNRFQYSCVTAMRRDNGQLVNLVSYRFRLPARFRMQVLNTAYIFRRRPAILYRTTYFMLPNPLGVNQGERDPVLPPFRYVPGDAVRLEGAGIGTRGLVLPENTTYWISTEEETPCGSV